MKVNRNTYTVYKVLYCSICHTMETEICCFRVIDSLWPSIAIWWHRTWLTWLVAWRHQPITWTDVDLSSVRSSGSHLRAILQQIPQPSINRISMTITYLNFVQISHGSKSYCFRECVIKLCELVSKLVAIELCCTENVAIPSRYC